MNVLATFVLHSTVLLGIAYVLDRWVVRQNGVREVIWKSALVASIASTVLVTAAPFVSSGLGKAETHSFQVQSEFIRGFDVPEAAVVRQHLRVSNGCIENIVLAEHGLQASGRSGEGLARCTAPVTARVAPWVVGLWGVAALFLVLRWVVGLGRVYRLTARAQPLPTPSGGHSVRVSSEIACPAAVGWSTVLLPTWSFQELSESQVSAALAHERAHLERGDPLWTWFVEMVCAIAFFQPLVRVARRRIQELSEVLSDGLAQENGASPVALARAIERCCSHQTAGGLRILAPGLGARSGPTTDRIKRLTCGESAMEPPMNGTKLALVCLLFLLAGCLPGSRIAVETEAEYVVLLERTVDLPVERFNLP